MKVYNDERIVNDIRMLSLDMINEANSGHPGIALGATPIIHALYGKCLKFKRDNPRWINRDRFVLSSGHGSAMLYATLFVNGYNYTIDDLKMFRKINSKTPGHPEYNVDLGIEMTTGPLGQGVATAVGMAIASKYLEKNFNTQKCKIFDYNIYCLCGDGDLMEGISYEACSLAGTLNLNNLILLYDANNISLDGNINLTFTENIIDRFIASNWDVIETNDKEKNIEKSIKTAKKSKKKPTLIIVKTTIGKYSKNENTNLVHGKPLAIDDLKEIRTKIGYNNECFSYDIENVKLYQKNNDERNNKIYLKWKETFESYKREIEKEKLSTINAIINNDDIIIKLERIIDYDKIETMTNMRDINEEIMTSISKMIPEFLGGSADVASSTKAYIKNGETFSLTNYNGKNIYYGVREHAMGAITNGLALSNLRGYCSTFLTFSDYLKPAIRLTSLMNIPAIYIFTHDSITIGSDGPTHQPIEQLNSLRMIPNFTVYRPANFKELIGSWNNILEKKQPAALVLSRNNSNPDLKTSINEVKRGGYVISEYTLKLDLIIIATGTEVNTAYLVKQKLAYDNIDARVVSIPNLNIFEEQDKEYINSLLPPSVKRFVIEYGNTSAWEKYTKKEYIFGIDTFGKSGTEKEVLEYFELDVDKIYEKIKNLR